MIMNSPNDIGIADSLLTDDYMQRPRIDEILDRVTRCKLVYVIAGAGYGKTQAIYHYIKQQKDAVIRWLQLTEGDNACSHYWESLTYNISHDNPDLAIKLRQLGFPETLTRFKQFAQILKNYEHRSHKTYLVLDDFHLINSKQGLAFAERCAYLQIPGACVIILSRKEPEINAVSLFSKGMASIVTEEQLLFTDNEIADFFSHCNVPFAAQNVPDFSSATKGWALAVKLLSLVLKRTPGNLGHALTTMKQNIYRLFDIEAFSDFPKSVRSTLVKLSLVSGLPLTPLNEISENKFFMENTPMLSSFMWYDSFIGDYRIHPLYLEFLQSKHDMLTFEEKQDAYRWAAQWCYKNNFYMDALNYYAKSFQYDQILEMLLSYPFILPYDTCEYFLSVLESIDPDGKEQDNRSILLLKSLFVPLLYIGMNKFIKACDIAHETIRKWEHQNTPLALYLLYTAYSNLAYVDTYTCTVTHKYDFAEHLKKAVKYFKASSEPPVRATGPFAVIGMRSFACLVGEGADSAEFDRFVQVSKETSQYVEQTYHYMYYGYDDLVASELAFFRNQPDPARSYAHNAVIKAREKKQHSIEAMAQYYLLRLAIHEGDYPLTREILKQIRGYLNNQDFWNRQLLHDLFIGSFYCNMELPERMPSWLILDETEMEPETHIPARELIVAARYYLAMNKNKQALAILCNSYPRHPQERFLFGELILSLLLAVARYRTGDSEGALKDFEKAWELSQSGEFEMPFIELGKSFRPLAAAAAKQESSRIPEAWLLTVERKASVYAKKTAVIIAAFWEEQKLEDVVTLSEREQEVLNDLYHGLSREEIATNRYLSINTVKKILQSIYIKLNANNNVDAIRIAIEKKLID